MRGDDISGAVVNLTARVEQAAGDREIYAKTAIREMMIGSDHVFELVGEHQLEGFEGDWRLYRLLET